MKDKVSKVLLFLLLVFVTASVTVAQTDSDESSVVKVTWNTPQIIFWDSEKKAEDVSGSFSLYWNNDGITDLKLNDAAKLNIRNFSFFMRGLYRKYLKEKIVNGEDLTKGELEALYLCLITEIHAINAYSYVFAKNLKVESVLDIESYLIPQRNKDIRTKNPISDLLQDSLRTMQQNFINSNDDLMKITLVNFANRYNNASKENREQDIQKSINNQREDLWGRYWYNPFFANIKINKKVVDYYDKCDINSQSFRSNWNAVCRRNDLCMRNIQEMREDLDKFQKTATNGANMNLLDSLDLNNREAIDKYTRTNLILFNDFPAITCAKKCLSALYDSKGFTYDETKMKEDFLSKLRQWAKGFTDDETKMKEAMTAFVTALRGEKIPLRFASTYSSSLYTQIVQFMKAELSEAEWAEYKLSMNLVNFDELNELFGIKKENDNMK